MRIVVTQKDIDNANVARERINKGEYSHLVKGRGQDFYCFNCPIALSLHRRGIKHNGVAQTFRVGNFLHVVPDDVRLWMNHYDSNYGDVTPIIFNTREIPQHANRRNTE